MTTPLIGQRAQWLAQNFANENSVFRDMLDGREYIYFGDYRRLYLPDEIQRK